MIVDLHRKNCLIERVYMITIIFLTSLKNLYTRLKKRSRVKSINDAQCDTMELWEDDRGKFVTEFRFLLFKIFSFQDNLKSKVRHAVLL